MVDGELQSCFCSPASRDPTRTIQYSSPVSSSYPPNLLSLWLYSTVQLAKKHKNNYTWSWTNIGWSVLVRGKTKMHYFKFPMLLLSLWLITLLSLTKTESAPTYSAHICSNSTFFIANGTYQTNLNLVLSSLTSDSSNNNNNGFYNASAGDNPADDVVSGLSLCRGDVNTTVCQDCVATASKDILRRCPLDKVAIIWYEECLLRYSNQSIFATINEVP